MIFDENEARAAAELGIAQADAGANETWMQRALEVVKVVAKNKEKFSSDDVWEVFIATYGEEYAMKGTSNLSALGAVFRKAAREGVCTDAGEIVRSKKVSQHQRPLRVWQSRVVMVPVV